MHQQHRHLQHGAVDGEEHLELSEPQVDQQSQRGQGARQKRERGQVEATIKHCRTQQALLVGAEHRLLDVHRGGPVEDVVQQRRGERGVGVPDEHPGDQEGHDDAPALAQFGVVTGFAGIVGKALCQGCQDGHVTLLLTATGWCCSVQPTVGRSCSSARSSTRASASCATAMPRRTSTARSSTKPSTKNSPVLKIARRWLPALSRVMRP